MDDKIKLIGIILFALVSIGTVHADDPVNIALASNGATASGGWWNPEPLIDGKTTGYTGSTGYAGTSWNSPLTITFDNEYTINKIHVLLWDLDSRYYQYKVETSIDNEVWTTVIDKTSGRWRSWQKDTIDPIKAKYIRIIGIYNSANRGFHVVEMEVYTQTNVPSTNNIALASNGATASGGWWNPEPLIDGKTTGYTGSTGYAGTSWNSPLTITFDNEYTINKIHVLLWDLDSRYYQYKVETSIDNEAWTTVIDKTSGRWKSWQKDAIDPIRAKYIRIIGTYNSANRGFHVAEMEAYISPNAPAPAPAPTPTPTPTPSPDLIWRGDWESGSIYPWERKTVGVEIVTNPVRTGKYAGKFTVQPGQEQWSVGNERAEVCMYQPREENGDEYYYAWSTKLGDNWRPVSDWAVFTQWHAPKPIRPAAALMLSKSDEIFLGMCTGDVSGNERTAIIVDDSIGVKMRKEVWNDFIVHIKWTTSSNGLIEIWYKTEYDESFKKVYTKSGMPTLQYGGHDQSIVYTKQQGLYRSITGYTQTIYHDGYRIGSTFESVLY